MASASKSKNTLTPFEDRVVIRPSEEGETMRGGLYIPDTAKEKPTTGEVIGAADAGQGGGQGDLREIQRDAVHGRW